MELYQAIKNRRSIRKYKGDPVPKPLIEKILDAANWAPSGMNEQPWEYIIVAGSKLDEVKGVTQEVINAILPPKDQRNEQQKMSAHWFSTLGGAPVAILQLAKREEDPIRKKMTLEGLGASFQNLLLAAYAEGLGTCWMTGPLMKADRLQEVLGVPSDKELIAVSPLGYPDMSPAPVPRVDATLATKVTWLGF
ncbi:MAG TPA: nitroreductase family protein [Syntrophomonadaceae bacterium]|nr:nitroreductase family protein [Syntrophomonadaceae bacterium]